MERCILSMSFVRAPVRLCALVMGMMLAISQRPVFDRAFRLAYLVLASTTELEHVDQTGQAASTAL